MKQALTRTTRPLVLATMIVALVGAVLPLPAGAVQVEHSVVADPNPVDITPQVLDGQVNAIIQMGDTVIVGGTFTQVRRADHQAVFDRPYVFAYDIDTGIIDPNFVPQVSQYVEALAPGPDGQSVFLGGNFTTVNDTTRKKVARVSLADGSLVTGFKANANALVLDVVANGQWLYVSGKFSTIGGVARSGLARVNPNTGALDANLDLPFTDPERGTMGVPHIDVTPDGSKLVAMGSFSKVAGMPRSQLAVLDLTTSPATVSSWQTSLTPVLANPTTTWCSSSFATWMRDVDISPDGSYFILGTTGAFRANRLCDTLTRWDLTLTGPNQAPVWINATGGDTTWAVATTEHAVYVGGHFRWVNNPYRGDAAGPGAVEREGIAALDPLNGLPLSWNPTHERGIGIQDIVGTEDGVFMGSDTDHAGNEFHQKIAMFPIETGTELLPPNTYELPNDLYNIDDNGSTANGFLGRRSYDLTAFGADTNFATPGINWTVARGAFAIDGRIYYGLSDGRIYWRTFDGITAGATATQVPLNGLDVQPSTAFLIPGTTTRVPALTTQITNATGMFYDNGRIYYTVSGDNRLYYRYFTPESQTIGANLFVASTGDGVPWNNVRGMTMASGKLLYSTTDDRLYRVDWNGAKPVGAVTQVSGPGIDARNWSARGLFVFDESADTHAPTKPGTPSGTSSSFDSIDLSWNASHDSQSTSVTYRIYRDGAAVAFDQFVGDTQGSISYTDGGLGAGSVHSYRVDAVDAAGNASPLSDASASITVLAPDTTPPADPGTPTGLSNTTSTVDLSWPASSDNESTTITYRIFRDTVGNQVGEVTGGTTGTIAFTDRGLWPDTTHQYWVQAVDENDNESAKVASADIQTLSAIFADDFSSATMANWTSVLRTTIDSGDGSASPPSARVNPTAQSAYSYRDLGTSLNQMCASTQVKVTDRDGIAVDLLRLRTAGGGAVAKVNVDASGGLVVRSDFAGTQKTSGVTLPSGWNLVELCGTTGASGMWDLYLNGAQIVTAWAGATGTEGVGRIQIGDTSAKTWAANFDDVVVDLTRD